MTKCCVTYRVQRTGQELTARFDTLLLRALFIIGITSYADVVREWTE